MQMKNINVSGFEPRSRSLIPRPVCVVTDEVYDYTQIFFLFYPKLVKRLRVIK